MKKLIFASLMLLNSPCFSSLESTLHKTHTIPNRPQHLKKAIKKRNLKAFIELIKNRVQTDKSVNMLNDPKFLELASKKFKSKKACMNDSGFLEDLLYILIPVCFALPYVTFYCSYNHIPNPMLSPNAVSDLSRATIVSTIITLAPSIGSLILYVSKTTACKESKLIYKILKNILLQMNGERYMFKNNSLLFSFFMLILLTLHTISHYGSKSRLRDSALLEAKLFLNKQQALIKCIIKRQALVFEIMLEKVERAEEFYGKLTSAEKLALLGLIKKEGKIEKNKLTTFILKDKLSLAKKGFSIAAILILECYLFQNLYYTPPTQRLKAFDAIAKHLKITFACVNIPIVMILNILTIRDFLKVNSQTNRAKLKLMKTSIKSLL